MYLGGFGFDTIILVGKVLPEKPFPFSIGEDVVVEFLQLHSEVFHKVFLLVDGQILIALFCESLYKVLFEHGLTLIFVKPAILSLKLTDYSIFFVFSNDVVCHSSAYAFFLKVNNLSL